MPVLSMDIFRTRFEDLVRDSNQTWESVGFALKNGDVLPFGTDTKVISTVFEALASAYIIRIANEFDYKVEGSPQTIYPDFTLVPNEAFGKKIAIDIKTTYRKSGGLVFTLGSYTSFLRDPRGQKNIKYPYVDYSDHWVIGFVYSRLLDINAKEYQTAVIRGEEICPYENVEFFVQHKHLIAGKRPGSGNTANIGSFRTNGLGAYRTGSGPFQTKEEFEDYWKLFK